MELISKSKVLELVHSLYLFGDGEGGYLHGFNESIEKTCEEIRIMEPEIINNSDEIESRFNLILQDKDREIEQWREQFTDANNEANYLRGQLEIVNLILESRR